MFDWIETGIVAVIGLLAFLGKRELNKIDAKADKNEVTQALQRLDAHIAECREQNEKVSDTLLSVSTAIARIEGRLGQ